MKKVYETPSVEKVAFQYRNQVVATSVPSTVCDQKQNWSGFDYEGGNGGACHMTGMTGTARGDL